MSLSLVVVCEAPADQETACGLADRVFRQEIDWLESEHLGGVRAWVGLETGKGYLLWREVDDLARAKGIRIHGHFDGRPGEADARAGRRALLLIKMLMKEPGGIVLLRDSDTQDRRAGLEQARANSKINIPIVIGLAHPMRECWVLAGFEPRNDEERQRLDDVRAGLGFDPCFKAHQLTAKHKTDKKSPKGVLSRLTQDDRDRETACWECTDLAKLRERGEKSGLKAYLDEVVGRLVPLIGGR